MVTTIHYAWSSDGARIFRADNGISLWVEDIKDGIVIIDPLAGTYIPKFAETIAGCLRETSNFKKEVLKAFNCDENAQITAIRFSANGATVLVTRDIADQEKIMAKWEEEMKAAAERSRLEWEEYKKTPEYRKIRAKELKKQIRQEAIGQDIIAVDKSTKMKFKDKEAAKVWRKFVAVNSKDVYSRCVVDFARCLAKYMQHLMKKHKTDISHIAHNASCHVAEIYGTTGFQYGCAVNALSHCWKYGDELRKWHNKEWGNEDAEGVINPAIIQLEPK